MYAKGFPKLLDPLVSVIARERWRRRDVSLCSPWGQGSTHVSTLSGTRCSEDLGLWASARRRCSTGSTKPENRPGSFACSALRRENRSAVTPSHRIGWASAMCSISLSIAASVLDELLTELSLQARRDGLAALCVDYFGARSKLTSRLRAFGFFRRAGRPLMIFVPQGSSVSGALRGENWALFAGDEDV